MNKFKRFVNDILRALERPVHELIVHLIIVLLVIGFVAATGQTMAVAQFDQKVIPGTSITISEWLIWLDVIFATLLIIIALIRSFRGA